jgi:uncharacterized membrane protein YkvA (DUF1232 family)
MKHLNEMISEEYIDESIKDVVSNITTYIDNCEFLQNIRKISKDILKKSGEIVVKNILKLYYILVDKKTAIHDKLSIIAALTYLISPIDVIPDASVIGFTDDAALIAYLLNTLKKYLTSEIEQKAENKFNEWFSK